MRVDALVNLETVQLDAQSPVIDIQFCVRLADKMLGGIDGSEACVNQSDRGLLLGVNDNGFGYISTAHEKHILGESVAVSGSELYLEYRLITTPIGVPGFFDPNILSPVAGGGNVFQPYLELV